MGRVWAAVLGSALCVAAAAQAAPANFPRRVGGPQGLVGNMAPGVGATRLAGRDPVQLDRLEGRVVIVDFWATWCGPCQPLMRFLDLMHDQHHAEGLTVLGLSTEHRSVIESHLQSRPVGYTIGQIPGATAQRFGVRSVPTLVLVDRHGKVRDVFVGVDRATVARLVSQVRVLLDEPAP